MVKKSFESPLSRLFFLCGILVVTIGVAFVSWPRTYTGASPVATANPPQSAGAISSTADAAAASVAVAAVVGCSLRFVFAPAGVRSVAPLGTITYHVVLTNAGTQQCLHTSISAYYADNESVVATSPTPRASDYYWVPGNLAPGASWRGTVVTSVSESAALSVSNEACATAANSPDVCAYNLIPIGASQSQTKLTKPSSSLTANLGEREVGLWVWQTPSQMSAAYRQHVVSTAANAGFNALYVTVDDYLDVAIMSSGSAKTSAQEAYLAKLHDFIALAGTRGIAVDLEGGANDWGQHANRWKGYALIDLLHLYNETYPDAPSRGLQYDVESYLSSAYADSKADTLANFADFVSASAAQMAAKNPGKRFSVVIPHFYDEQIAWTPQISYNGTREYVLTALLQGLQADPGSYLIVMAYRNFLDGTNGTIALAHAEVAEASSGYATKVIVAQETGNVPPNYVTFYGKSSEDLLTALAGIESAFNTESAFGGVAVDYFEPFAALSS